jgi:hypothetical protein
MSFFILEPEAFKKGSGLVLGLSHETFSED